VGECEGKKQKAVERLNGGANRNLKGDISGKKNDILIPKEETKHRKIQTGY